MEYTREEVTALIEKYRPFLLNEARRLAGYRKDFVDDILSTLILHYVTSLRRGKYDPNRARLSSYAHKIAKRLAGCLIDEEMRRGVHVPSYCKVQTPVVPCVELVDVTDEDSCEEEGDRNDLPDHFWEKVRGVLDKDEWIVVDLWFRQRKTARQIAAVLGKSRSYYILVLRRALPKLASAFPQWVDLI